MTSTDTPPLTGFLGTQKTVYFNTKTLNMKAQNPFFEQRAIQTKAIKVVNVINVIKKGEKRC